MIPELKDMIHAPPNSTARIASCNVCGEIYRAHSIAVLRGEAIAHAERTGHTVKIQSAPPVRLTHF